jgi:hypothetical protein
MRASALVSARCAQANCSRRLPSLSTERATKDCKTTARRYGVNNRSAMCSSTIRSRVPLRFCGPAYAS